MATGYEVKAYSDLGRIAAALEVIAGRNVGKRGARVTDHEIVLAIQQMLDGTEWQASLVNDIAQLLSDAGYAVRDIEE